MNFEEMLNAQEGLTPKREKLSIGDFYRKQIDGKYRFVVELKTTLTDSIAFGEALKKDAQWSLRQRSKHQLRFEAHEDNGSLTELELESGNWQTLSQVLFADPAVVAQRGFVDQLVADLMDYAAKLHAEHVFHLCFAPQSIFFRKGDTAPYLLTHGSFFQSLGDQRDLYEGSERFVAPEVLSQGTIDERSDVYSLGQLIAYLFEQSSLPFEYKPVVKKATAKDPAQRFKSIEDMKSALVQRRSTIRGSIAVVSAIVIALLCFWLYVEMMPQAETIEFVQPAQKAAEGDPFDAVYDPETGALEDNDTLTQAEMDAYQKKAEEIMQRRAEREAEAEKQATERRPMRAMGTKESVADEAEKSKQE